MIEKDKYSSLWEYIEKWDGDFLSLSFSDIEKIAGTALGHSFLKYKKNLEKHGWKVGRISMKSGFVTFEKICKD